MICYLIPNCSTCVTQMMYLMTSPDPKLSVRFIKMEEAKKVQEKFPLWINGKEKHQGLLKPNKFGKFSLGCGRGPVPNGREMFLYRNVQNKPLKAITNINPKNIAPRNCFGSVDLTRKPITSKPAAVKSKSALTLLGSNNSIQAQKKVDSVNCKRNASLKQAALKSGNKLMASGLKIKANKNGSKTITYKK